MSVGLKFIGSIQMNIDQYAGNQTIWFRKIINQKILNKWKKGSNLKFSLWLLCCASCPELHIDDDEGFEAFCHKL